MEDWIELDIDNKNIGLLCNFTSDLPVNAPTEKDKQDIIKGEMETEHEYYDAKATQNSNYKSTYLNQEVSISPASI